MSPPKTPESYPFWTMDKIRYGDTDKLGHVNNAVFATFLETGRVDMLCHPTMTLNDPGTAYVLARLACDFHGEVHWPGEVKIGTRIASVGRSSLQLQQLVLQDDKAVASGETVLVQMDEVTRKSRSFSPELREKLEIMVR